MAVTADNRCTPLSEWPDADREAWLFAIQDFDLLNPAVGQANRWAPATREMIVRAYGRWLGWLQLIDELHTQEHPGARATEDRVERYWEALQQQGLADYTQSRLLQSLGDALKVMAPDEDFSWIGLAASRIHNRAKPSRDWRSRLRPADEVLQLGLDMIAAANGDRFRTPIERACLHRDGLLIGFLVLRPLRLKNLTALSLDRHLHRRDGEWWVEVEEGEGKTRTALEFPWPGALSEALDTYLEVHRQRLLQCSLTKRDGGEALWISKQGTSMTPCALSFQIKCRTEEEFGEAINPHAFRSVAATSIAIFDPENATIIAAILGHSSPRSSDKFYNRAGAVEAGRRFHTVMADVRSGRVMNFGEIGTS